MSDSYILIPAASRPQSSCLRSGGQTPELQAAPELESAVEDNEVHPGTLHRFFTIPELVLYLLGKMPREDQVSFGQTCSMFWNLAEPFIWRRISQYTLESFMPDTQAPSYNKRNRIAIANKTLKSILPKYARHVRALRLKETTWHKSHAMLDMILNITDVLNTSEPLLPALESVDMELWSEEAVANAGLIVRRPLKVLKAIVVDGDRIAGDRVSMFLDDVAQRGTGKGVQTLDLSVGKGAKLLYPGTDASLLRLIFRLPNIKKLCLSFITNGTRLLPLLAEFRNLEYLYLGGIIDHSCPMSECNTPYQLPCDAFPTLKTLFIQTREVREYIDMVLLLDGISSPCLAELRFPSNNLVTLRRTNELIAQKWTHSLTKVYVAAEIPGLSVSFELFAPLLACRQLEDVSVHQRAPYFDFADNDVASMADGWPKLLSLHVIDGDLYGPEVVKPPTLTQRSLIFLATKCKALHSLRLSISIDNESARAAPHAPANSGSILENLRFNSLSCEDPQIAADLLKGLFPKLRYLTTPRSRANMLQQESYGVDVSKILGLPPIPFRWPEELGRGYESD